MDKSMLGLKHLKQLRDEEHKKHIEFETRAAGEHARHKTSEVQQHVKHESTFGTRHLGHEST